MKSSKRINRNFIIFSDHKILILDFVRISLRQATSSLVLVEPFRPGISNIIPFITLLSLIFFYAYFCQIDLYCGQS